MSLADPPPARPYLPPCLSLYFAERFIDLYLYLNKYKHKRQDALG